MRIPLDKLAIKRERWRMSVNDSINRIRAFALAKGWSRNRLATEARIAESTIRSLYEPDWNPTIHTVQALEGIIPDGFVSSDEAA